MIRMPKDSNKERITDGTVFVRPISRIPGFSRVVRDCFAEVFPGEMAHIIADLKSDCDPSLIGLVVQSRVRNSKLRG